jgi:ABC-2 type transport system ATP-binding protein
VLQALVVENLTKVYSQGIRAVDFVSFSVEQGEIFGLLGPNGAGKTTTIKMIVTISKPTSGSIRVFGLDALRYPERVREMIGYIPQAVSVDGDLTGYENLLIFSKLSYVPRSERSKRIQFALEYMGLKEKENELVKHYSGGMMRRLELAQALVNRPRLLILDEPSIGLDPASKIQIWNYLKQMNNEFGTTILMTTHDMIEADRLCHRIAIMNSGRIAVVGSPQELKDSIGGEIVTIGIKNNSDKIEIPEDIGNVLNSDNSRLRISVHEAEKKIPVILEYLFSKGIKVDFVSSNKPSLDDVFLKYAKVSFEQGESYSQARMTRRVFARRAG